MLVNRSGDGNGIERAHLEKAIKISQRLDFRIEALQVHETFDVKVANRPDVAVRDFAKVADQIGPPIATTDDAYSKRPLHKIPPSDGGTTVWGGPFSFANASARLWTSSAVCSSKALGVFAMIQRSRLKEAFFT